jgi:hypothetical protein
MNSYNKLHECMCYQVKGTGRAFNVFRIFCVNFSLLPFRASARMLFVHENYGARRAPALASLQFM